MKFGYTILYCRDVAATVAHYEAAFGLKQAFFHDSGLYAEMATGETALAFAANDLAEMNDVAIRPNNPKHLPGGFEIAFVDPDVPGAYARAIANGATPVKPPEMKPWGQIVAYVRDIDGCLVELASPLPARDA